MKERLAGKRENMIKKLVASGRQNALRFVEKDYTEIFLELTSANP